MLETAACVATPVLGGATLVVIVALALTALASAALRITRRRQDRRELRRQTVMRLYQYRLPSLAEQLALSDDGSRSALPFAGDVPAFSRQPREFAAETATVRVA